MVRFWQVRNRDERWFDGIKDIWKHLGKYEYFGTFHFGKEYELSFDEASKCISHFRNVFDLPQLVVPLFKLVFPSSRAV